MNTLIYWGVVLAGAVTLLIEAYRNFNSSLTSVPFKEHRILQNVEVANLSTTREKNVGFAFYSLLYLVTYAVVLSSAEVLALLEQAARAAKEIGPMGVVGTEQDSPLSSAGYGKPIFISASIIAIFSIGALKPVEGTMRSLSHRIAGIPRGVYRVIDDLHAIEFDTYDYDCQKPLTGKFEGMAKQHFDDSPDSDQVGVIKTALLTIDYLAPAITGAQRVQHFPFTQLETMSDLSDKLDLQVKELRELLQKAPRTKEAREEVRSAAMLTANDSIALFAVHFLRNNRAIKNRRPSTAIAAVYEKIKGSYQIEFNSFGMALVVSLIAALVSGFLVIWYWAEHARPINSGTEVWVREVRDALGTDAIFGAEDDSKIAACLAAPPPEWREETESGADESGGAPEGAQDPGEGDGFALSGADAQKCDDTWNRVMTNIENRERQNALKFVLREYLPTSFAVFLAALAAIVGRDVRREDNSWPTDWKLRRFPFMRMLSLSVIPALLAVFGIALGAFIGRWIGGNYHLTENEMTFFFETNGLFFLMNALLGMVVSIGALVLMDQHDKMHIMFTLLLGLGCGIVALFAYYLIVLIGYPPEALGPSPEGVGLPFGLPLTFAIREALVWGAVATYFLLFFGLFLEVTEDSADQTTEPDGEKK